MVHNIMSLYIIIYTVTIVTKYTKASYVSCCLLQLNYFKMNNIIFSVACDWET